MNQQSLKVTILLMTVWSVALPHAVNSKEASDSNIWRSKCEPMSDPKPPDIEDLELDEILAAGLFHMNLQTKKANNGSLGTTFVFGSVGSGKSSVTPLMVGKLKQLNVGLTKSNQSIIYRNDNPLDSRSPSMIMTLLPDYYLSQSDDSLVAFWDCPGFNYSLGSKADIAQLYFLKHALEVTKSAKFIFTITHSSVMLENHLRMLANYATTLIKDVRKFKDSIGLIVTQVEYSDVRGEGRILSSIRNFLKSYIDIEHNIIVDERKQGREVKENHHIWQRIAFVEGLLLQEEVSVEQNVSRINFIESPNACADPLNMSLVWDTVAKLKAFRFISLKNSKIVPEDFRVSLRPETVQEIDQVLWAEEFTGVAKYAVTSSQEVLKELERILLGSQNEVPMLEFLNGFQLAYDHHFSQPIGHSPRLSWSNVEVLNQVDDDINFFMTCSSQKMKTINFYNEIMGGKYEAANISTLWEPFKLAKRGLNDLTEFHNFCNKTYHTLGEYSYQIKLKDSGIHVGNVLEFLANAAIEIPDTILSIWESSLDESSKKYLVELVTIQIPDVTYKHEYVGQNGIDYRLTAVGRIIRLTEIYEFLRLRDHSQDKCNRYTNCNSEMILVATEKFYIDRYIQSADGIYSISVVAPIWEAVLGFKNVGVLTGSGDFLNGDSMFGVYSSISKDLLFDASGDKIEYRDFGGNAGSLYFISTRSIETVYVEACPGNGNRRYGNFSDTIYTQAHAISVFNREFIRLSLFNCFSLESEDFFQKLSSYSEGMLYKYTPISLVTELEYVEKEFYAKYNNINYCPAKMKRMLAVYYERTLKLIKELLVEANPMDYTALTWIGSLIIGRKISNKRLDITLNVFDTAMYMEAVEEDLKALEIIEHKVAIQKEEANYKSALDGKVKEAEKSINTTVQPAIENADKMVKRMNGKLLELLDVFLDAAKAAAEDAKKRKQEFVDSLPLKYLFASLNIVATAVSFLGPVGSAVSNGIMVATSVGQNFVDKKPLDLGPVVKYTKQLDDDSDKFYQDKIDASKAGDDGNQQISVSALKAVSFGASAVDAGLSLFRMAEANAAMLHELDKAIRDAENQVDGIKNLQDDFKNNFAPALDAMGDSVLSEASMLNGTSPSGLTVKKFQMKETLKNMDSMMKGFTGWITDAQDNMKMAMQPVLGEPNVYGQFLSAIQTLERALDALFEMYAHIEMYQERKELAQFIANVNSPTPAELNSITNMELRNALTRVSVSIQINVVYEEYKKAEHAFKQWVFPFANSYIKGKSDHLFMQSKDFKEAVGFCRQQISHFKSLVKKANSVTVREDQYLRKANFSSDLVSTKPFYVWTNDKWQDAIRRLFQGEEIMLKADVDLIGLESAKHFKYKTAIKFHSIFINIKAINKTLQDELYETLKHFRMYMTHSGVSIYKVTGQHFVMRDKPQLYSYNFEKYSDINLSKDKGERPQSDFLLSPYTWWTLRIREETDATFEVLQKFITNVNLTLEGSGRYLDELDANMYGHGFLSDLNLSEYYDTYEPSNDAMLPVIPTVPFKRRCGLAPSVPKRSPRLPSSKFDEPFIARIQTTVGNPANVQKCYHQVECLYYSYNFTTFDGEYTLVTDPDNDDLGEYLKAMDYSEYSQAEIRNTKDINVTIEEGKHNRYSVVIITNSTERDFYFKSGREFETDLGDGRRVTNKITIDTKYYKTAIRVIKMMDFEATNEVLFCHWGFRVTLKAKDAEAVLAFKRL